MKKEKLTYKSGNVDLHGYLCFKEDAPGGKKPAVLVIHAWKGQDAFAKEKAEKLAEMGYVGFAVDLYGISEPVKSNEEASRLMQPLFQNRKLLRERVVSAFQFIANHPEVDSTKIGSIGYCFGGLASIELYRSGVPIKGAVSFHGLLGDQKGEFKAQTVPIASDIKGSILIYHGHDDPLVTQEDILNLQKELTDHQLDWQFHTFGGTTHAFTVPGMNEPEMGLKYNLKADQRSWQGMKDFFVEVFQ